MLQSPVALERCLDFIQNPVRLTGDHCNCCVKKAWRLTVGYRRDDGGCGPLSGTRESVSDEQV